VPLFFSNEQLFVAVNAGLDSVPPLVRELLTHDRQCRPYSYSIRKTAGGARQVAIPHPAVQVRVAEFYESHRGFIQNLCGRSGSSLRFPSRVASSFYLSQFANDEIATGFQVDSDPASFDDQRTWASTYFAYKRFSYAYKFFESNEFQRLEVTYPYLLSLDVAKCFESI
jgi:hypothetical protein